MTGFVRSQYVNVGATASAAILAFGLVTVPPERYDSVIARTEFAAVQLQAAVSTQIASLAGAAVTSAASAATPAAPQASATQAENDTLTVIATAAISLVVAPLWYLAFPVTLPLTVLGSAFGFGTLLAAFSIGTGSSVSLPGYQVLGALLGVPFFLVAPFAVATLLARELIGPSDTVVPAAARGSASQVGATNTDGPSSIVADIPAAGTDVAPDTGSVSSPNRRERGSAQRGRSVTQPATTTTAPAASATVETNTETATSTVKPTAARQSARGAAKPAASATVETNTETATSTVKPTAARQSARGAAHRAERSAADRIE